MARSSIPQSVENMIWARTVRYVGWGFGESLVPIFIMSVAGSYAAAGLIQSTLDVTLLLFLPLAGLLAERFTSKWMVVIDLLLYPFVGISYYLAGVTGLAFYLVVARAINGVAFALDSTGVDTYIRRFMPSSSIGKAFGLLDAISNFGWIMAAIAGIWLIKYFPIYDLLMLVGPFALLSLPFVLRTRPDHPSLGRPLRRISIKRAYAETLEEWQGWGSDLRLLALLFLFTEAITTLIGFFIPITIYKNSGNLSLVIVFTIVITIPVMFGYFLGRTADHRSRPRLAAVACASMAIILLGLSLPLSYSLVVFAGLLLGVLLELLSILQRSIATELVTADHFGRLDSVFNFVYGISALATPPILGAALDIMSLQMLASLLAATSFILALVFVLHAHPKLPKRIPVLPAPERV